LKGVVTHHKSASKAGYVADFGKSFNAIEPRLLQMHSSDYEMRFFQKECMEHLDEYLLIDGVHLVRRVASSVTPNY
jgi:hypothetical protein